MRKMLKLTALIAVILIALTGCVKVDYNVKINKDDSGEISYLYGFEKSYLETMGTTSPDILADMQKQAQTNGYEIEAYQDDTIEGFKAKKELKNVGKQFSLEEAFGETYVQDSEENKIVIDEKSNGQKTYSQKATVDLTNMENANMYGIVLTYTITLPVQVGLNNANTVSEDGKTLTWDLQAGEINQIEFEASSKKGNSTPINTGTLNGDSSGILANVFGKEFSEKLDDIFGGHALLVVGVGTGLFIILIICLLIRKAKKKKKKKAKEANLDENKKETEKLEEIIEEKLESKDDKGKENK